MEQAVESKKPAWPKIPEGGGAPVAFEVNLQGSDWADEISRYFVRRFWHSSVVMALLFAILEFITVEEWNDREIGELVMWPIAGAGFILAYFFFMGRRSGRRVYDTTPYYQRPLDIILTDTRVYTSAPGIESAQDLAMFHAVRETRTAFLVYLNAMYFLLWPKRGFKSGEDIKRVREYLKQGLPGKAKIKLRND